MQIQLDDIGDGERVWWQIGEEEFVDVSSQFFGERKTDHLDEAVLF
jgi:hypothetical protein